VPSADYCPGLCASYPGCAAVTYVPGTVRNNMCCLQSTAQCSTRTATAWAAYPGQAAATRSPGMTGWCCRGVRPAHHSSRSTIACGTTCGCPSTCLPFPNNPPAAAAQSNCYLKRQTLPTEPPLFQQTCPTCTSFGMERAFPSTPYASSVLSLCAAMLICRGAHKAAYLPAGRIMDVMLRKAGCCQARP
jgi:hypothetical protein